jgi:hypothetical protein
MLFPSGAGSGCCNTICAAKSKAFYFPFGRLGGTGDPPVPVGDSPTGSENDRLWP